VRGNDQVAPIPDLAAFAPERGSSTQKDRHGVELWQFVLRSLELRTPRVPCSFFQPLMGNGTKQTHTARLVRAGFQPLM
jgi:hypothetical protein